MIRHHPLLSEEIEKGEATVAVEEEEEKADLFLRWPWWRWLGLSLLCYTHTHPHSHTTRHPCTPTHPYAHPTRHTPRHTPIPPPHTQTASSSTSQRIIYIMLLHNRGIVGTGGVPRISTSGFLCHRKCDPSLTSRPQSGPTSRFWSWAIRWGHSSPSTCSMLFWWEAGAITITPSF